jgi:hypothetical protein
MGSTTTIRFSAGGGNFSLRHLAQTGSGAHPACYPMDTGALSLGVKRPECEAEHSSPSNADIKNVLSYNSTTPYVFMAWYLIKHRM